MSKLSFNYDLPSGPYEALPGRSHNGDYWPVFPFASQYSGGLDLDPSISRHIGGDINIPVPSWGILDINGHYFNRISDTTTKFGYISHPVNMLGLDKNDFARLVSDPALAYNRNFQPLIPLGKVPRSHVPISCRAPMCNPYTGTFAFGVEHDLGGHDGVNGDIDVPIPMGKGIAYRFPIGGNIHYDLDNITISYGHNLSPIDPYSTLFTGPNLHPYEHYPEQKHGPQAQLRRPKRAVDLYAEQFGRDDEAMYRQQWPMSREISLNDLMRGRSVDLEELYPSVAVAEESFDLPMYLFRVGSFLP
ncbi:Protein F35D2.2 [Aphelenchoides avenae]|nr:Protein F35D2.2 [Aphelenchus avenae]